MSRFPDFTDLTLFPTFASLPLSTDDVPSSPSSPAQTLLATISENMTLSTSPTFICKDPSGTPFALTMRIPSHLVQEGVRGGGYDVARFKKGSTVVVREGIAGRRVVRSGVGEGKQGFVETGVEGILIVPASLGKLVEIGERERGFEREDGKERCQACGEAKEVEKLSRCKGCESVWYCDKECQTKGWSEKGHKGECKVYRALTAAFPGGGGVA